MKNSFQITRTYRRGQFFEKFQVSLELLKLSYMPQKCKKFYDKLLACSRPITLMEFSRSCTGDSRFFEPPRETKIGSKN